MKIKLGVLFGGKSVEHEVSIISALQAINHLDKTKYEIIPIYISKENEWYTSPILNNIEIYKNIDEVKKKSINVILYNKDKEFVLQSKTGFKKMITTVDIILPIVHGANIEDGTIQGYLDMIGIPYALSEMASAVIGQDKVFQKQIFIASNIPVVDFVWFFENEYVKNTNEIIEKIENMGYPVIIKPARLGSSVGISIANNKNDLIKSIEDAITYDKKILVEKVVSDLIEINCSVIGNENYSEASVLEEVMGNDEFLSYKDKYLGGSKSNSKGMVSTNRIIPARIDDNKTLEIKNISKEVFRNINASGVIRIDYLMDKNTKEVFVNEVNTIPGSLSFYLWKETNKDYSKLLDEIITIAIKIYKDKKNKVYSFSSNILENQGGLKGSKTKFGN